MAVLPAAPALAQDSTTQTPVIVLPDPAPAPADPIMRDTPPSPTPVTMTPAALEVEAPVEAAPAVEAVETEEAAQPVAAATADEGAAAPANETGLTADFAPLAEAAPVAARPVRAPAPMPDPIEDNSSEALIFGLLAALAIAGIAFLALRSRRRVAEAHPIERPMFHRESASAIPPVLEREPEATASHAPERDSSLEPAPAVAGVVPLPRKMPRSFEERNRLIRRMVAAPPDRANPFTSVKARTRRARLILASLGRRFESAKPRIDLSQYGNNWPSLRGWRPATA